MEPVSEEPLPALETIAYARELLDQNRPFSAHEVLEARWKDCPEQERPLWQGLAQLCVGLTHAARGNAAGARTLLDRGARQIEGYAGETYGLDVAAIIACALERDAAHTAQRRPSAASNSSSSNVARNSTGMPHEVQEPSSE